MVNLDAGIGEPLRERTTRPGNQQLFQVEARQATNQQLGLSFAATVAFCQVDVGNSHVHRSPRVWNGR
jgi:hypothetical protein